MPLMLGKKQTDSEEYVKKMNALPKTWLSEKFENDTNHVEEFQEGQERSEGQTDVIE